VDDVVATANYYRDRLGFRYERFWGDPPAFCTVTRAGVVIMLNQFERTSPCVRIAWQIPWRLLGS
jgi:hypothetical protein